MEPNSLEEPSAKVKINPPVFFTSVIIIVGLVLFSILFKTEAAEFFSTMKTGVQQYASWFYILTVAILLSLVVFVIVSRYGDIKLGPDHSEPDYSYGSWFAMLFSAGMGIGLMFYGVAEPVLHYMSPPMAEPGSIDAAKEAMRVTFFHWGLHAWAIYAVVAMILAYFSFRHGLPLTLRSALYPLIGKKIYGPIGHMVDVFAVVGTVFGVATSLGLGVEQVNAGLNHLFGLPKTEWVQVGLIISITARVEPGPGVPAIDVRAVPGTDPVPAEGLCAEPRRLSLQSGGHDVQSVHLSAGGERRQRTTGLARRLDPVLLGLVDFLVTVRGHVHRPHFPRPVDP